MRTIDNCSFVKSRSQYLKTHLNDQNIAWVFTQNLPIDVDVKRVLTTVKFKHSLCWITFIVSILFPHRRVSVVIPTFGRQKALDCALKSLASEEQYIVNVVVVDDCSPNPIVVNAPVALRDRINLVRLDINVGSSAARQIGVDKTKGELIAFLDSDDIWLPGKLEAQLPYFKDQGVMMAVATGWQVVRPANGQVWCRMPKPSESLEDFASGCWFCPGSTVVISREAFEKCGEFDPNLRRLEDFEWFLRFASIGGKLEVADICGAIIHQSKKHNRAVVDLAAAAIQRKFLPQFGKHSRIYRKLIAWLDVERGAAAYAEGKFVAAAALILRSFWRSPRSTIQLKSWWRASDALFPLNEAKRLLDLDD